MPSVVSIEEVPAVVRARADSPHAANVSALRDWLVTGGEGALAYGAGDGVTDKTFAATVQALRNAAKALGCRLRVRWTSSRGMLYVTNDGQYVPMSPEKVAARQEKRAAAAASARKGEKKG